MSTSNPFDVLNDLNIFNQDVKSTHQSPINIQLLHERVQPIIKHQNLPLINHDLPLIEDNRNYEFLIKPYGQKYIPKSNEVVIWYLSRSNLAKNFNDDSDDVYYYYTSYNQYLGDFCYSDARKPWNFLNKSAIKDDDIYREDDDCDYDIVEYLCRQYFRNQLK